jgi:hypothetical protein
MKKNGLSEKTLDDFRQDLNQYEALVGQRQSVAGQLNELDQQVALIRQKLMERLVVSERPARLKATLKTTGETEPDLPMKTSIKAPKLNTLHPNLQGILKVLRKEREAGVPTIESAIGTKRALTMYHINRGIKLGLVKRLKKGVFALNE